MDITEATIPAPVFVSGSEMRRLLQDLGAPLAALSPRRDERADATVPDQFITPGQERLLCNIIVHRSAEQQNVLQPQANPQLVALEILAKADPELRRHRLFWRALQDAKLGRGLGKRQRQLLDLAWTKLRDKRRHGQRFTPVSPRSFRDTSLQLDMRYVTKQITVPRPASAHTLELRTGSALGNANLQRLTPRLQREAQSSLLAKISPRPANRQALRNPNAPERDDSWLAPIRDDSWLPSLKPNMSDTDSGDDA